MSFMYMNFRSIYTLFIISLTNVIFLFCGDANSHYIFLTIELFKNKLF